MEEKSRGKGGVEERGVGKGGVEERGVEEREEWKREE